jgi:hypothetical protein
MESRAGQIVLSAGGPSPSPPTKPVISMREDIAVTFAAAAGCFTVAIGHRNARDGPKSQTRHLCLRGLAPTSLLTKCEHCEDKDDDVDCQSSKEPGAERQNDQ